MIGKKYSNFTLERAIDEYIHNKRNRQIMKLKWIDGLSAREIADLKEIDIDERQVKNVLKKGLEQLADYI
jgi:DNA-directed RNA polymerase specialized sigma24 family protein